MTSVDVGAIAGLVGVVALIIYILADPANARHRRVVALVLTLCLVAGSLRILQLII